MKHLVSATALTLLLAACSGGNDTAPTPDASPLSSEAAAPSAQSDVSEPDADASIDRVAGDRSVSTLERIPAHYIGNWATDPDACSVRNHERLTIERDRVTFFEDGGWASDIRGDGDALAVTYPFENPDGATENRVVYFARETQDRIRVRRGDGRSITYTRCASQQTQGSTQANAATVPERFRGLYALDRRACAEDYTYNPAFQNVRVNARDVGFFETGGPVTDVNVDGDTIAITLNEKVGDATNSRAIFLRLTGDGTARYRAGRDEPVRDYVRCG